ncbi:MAG: transcriptional regulator GcvA [Gammaproteobacteria bacterium]|nr:transcriptional regulator GcvA [Gammaproteobacteria bacterium]
MAEHLPFNALRAFEAAARHLSFKLAAEELFVTPAAISQQIKFLEDTLGIPLFHRYNRKIELTDAAKRGLPKLIEGFSTLSDGVALMKQPDDSSALTVWTSPAFATKWLMPRLPEYRRAHPDVDLNISGNRDLIDNGRARKTIPAENFRRDKVDIAIRFGQGDYPGCRVDKLLSVSAIPLCSPSLLDGPAPLESPDDLRHHTLLHDETPYEGRPAWSAWLEAAGVGDIDSTHGMTFNSAALVLAAAIAGQGVALTLQTLADDDIADGRLVIPFDLSLPMDYDYYVITLEETADQPEIKAFREWLLDSAGESDSARVA